MSSNESEEKVVSELERLSGNWMHMCTIIRIAHCFLLVAGVGCSILVPVLVGLNVKDNNLSIVSVGTALFMTLATTFKGDVKANQLRRGWVVLFNALLRYKAKRATIDEVIKAHKEAEDIIGDFTPEFRSERIQSTTTES